MDRDPFRKPPDRNERHQAAAHETFYIVAGVAVGVIIFAILMAFFDQSTNVRWFPWGR
ncbi:MAG: hypothetical protein KF784_15430 [Fimbriimonadaceae bacterium]|nr:hypothetical protein [Fimbriimonadaceae bacterium]